MNKLFQSMFADSPIAKGFHPSVDNIRCMTNYGIAPYYKDLLTDSLKKSDCFIVSFDESLNNFVKSCGRVLLLRYSDSDDFIQSNFVTMILDFLIILITKIL